MACLKNNDTFTWTFVVKNNSIIPVTGVTNSVTIPPGVSVISSVTTKGSYNIGTGIWSLGTVGVGASHTLTISVLVTDQTLQPYTSTALVAGNEFEPYLINNVDNDSKGGPCTDECSTGFICSDNPVSCTCGQITLLAGSCNTGSVIDYRVVAGSEVNATVNLDSVSGHYQVSLLDYSQPWSFDYEIYCCCDSVCTGPLTSCTISGVSDIDCSTWGFVVNAGITDVVTDNVNGEQNISVCGTDTVHFWSSDGSINVTVSPGSAIVDINLNLDVLFSNIDALPIDCAGLIP